MKTVDNEEQAMKVLRELNPNHLADGGEVEYADNVVLVGEGGMAMWTLKITCRKCDVTYKVFVAKDSDAWEASISG